MYKDNKILLAKSNDEEIYLNLSMANRHGLIAGATGTGKTTTLKVLAESFAQAGVNVFLSDIKGDLGSLIEKGEDSDDLIKRKELLKLNDFPYQSYKLNFWDVYQERGIPLRTTISEMGPILLSQVLRLNDTQSSLLQVVFQIADDQNLLLIDIKDLKALLVYINENNKELAKEYGNLPSASINTIIRNLLSLQTEGGDKFFGEPALDIHDFLTLDSSGIGSINLLQASKLINTPTLYSAFMLWLLSTIYETMPEVGDLDKPKIVFFFDEAHLLFANSSTLLLEKIEQMVKLVRSKGVGIYFITQLPTDIPTGVLSQLSNKILHGLRAYTPSEQKACKVACESLRENPDLDTYDTLLNLGKGEALISTLDEEGVPEVVKKGIILPPQSKLGTVNQELVNKAIKESVYYSKYFNSIDRDSAYEFLKRMELENDNNKEIKENTKPVKEKKSDTQKAIDRATKNVASSSASSVGRELGKSIGSTLFGKKGKTIGGNIGASLARGIVGTLFTIKK